MSTYLADLLNDPTLLDTSGTIAMLALAAAAGFLLRRWRAVSEQRARSRTSLTRDRLRLLGT